MKTTTLIILMFLILAGCSTILQGNCVDRAIHSAMVAQRAGYEVRIAEGPTKTPGVNHWQAEMFVNGKWKALDNGWARVWTSGSDHWFRPEKYLTLKEALELYKFWHGL